MTAGTITPSPGSRQVRLVAARGAGDLVPPVIAFFAAVAVWELIVRAFGLKQFILPSPLAIGAAWF
jgi:ABC-type nitrate/sulfonate/bicarbonate transport system permease component